MSNVFLILKNLLQHVKLPPVVIVQGTHKETHAFFKKWEELCACQHLNACGKCDGCLLMSHENHPDMLWIQPHQMGHGIKIDQIRDLQQQCMYTPQINSSIYVFIEGADGLNLFSANALLKLLEEPPEKVHFFLSVENPSLLPKTILSRCWLFQVQQELPLSIDSAGLYINDDNPKAEILNHYPALVTQMQQYLHKNCDVSSMVRFFEPFGCDDILWLLQFYTLRIMEILQSKNPSSSPEWIAAISTPVPVWWQFWDALIELRRQLRIQSSLQVNLQITRLFLILHGLK